MNGDIYTNLKFKSLIDYHKKNGNFCTVCTRDYNFSIPYGVINRGKELIDEKPDISKKFQLEYMFLINQHLSFKKKYIFRYE